MQKIVKKERHIICSRFFLPHLVLRIAFASLVFNLVVVTVSIAGGQRLPLTTVQAADYTTAGFTTEGVTFTVSPILRIEPNDWLITTSSVICLQVTKDAPELAIVHFYEYKIGGPPPARRLTPVDTIPGGFQVEVPLLPGDFLHFWAVVADMAGRETITRTIVVKVLEETH